MRKRLLVWLLTIAMVITVAPYPAFGDSSSSSAASGGDALSALGIDSSASPEGFDPDSTDNPYGKNTVTLTPVSELYKVGLDTDVTYEDSYTIGNDITTDEKGSNTTVLHDTEQQNVSLTASLYGNDNWGSTTTKQILGRSDDSTVEDNGTMRATGTYTEINSGIVSDVTKAHSATGYLNGASSTTTEFKDSSYALSAVASGNFDKNTKGLTAQTAMVYTQSLNNNGGLYLQFGDAESGNYGSPIQLLSTGAVIGNPDLTDEEGNKVENFAENPYQMKNYLQVSAGDWNGDGCDEVAVYIPEKGNSRIAVYALQLSKSDDPSAAYRNPAKWGLAWTYYLKEGSVVSNMVSLVSGDVNKDGTDDISATWGYYYGPSQNIGSTAVVMFGAKGTAMFKSSQQFDLTYGTSDIVRASFAFGDMSGAGEDSLILCGQSDSDLKAGNVNTRYVAMYSWNGTAFTSGVYQDFDLFATDGKGNYKWSAMSDAVRKSDKDVFYSLPLCVSDTAIITRPITEDGGDLLYFDSLIIEYSDKGLSISQSCDNTSAMQSGTACENYVEYSAAAGDLAGQTGAGALAVMTQTMSLKSDTTASYSISGTYQKPVYKQAYYYKNWWYRLIGRKTCYNYIASFETVDSSTNIDVSYQSYTAGSTYMTVVDLSENYYINRSASNSSYAICMANTDNDSTYMNYSGKHYYTYTDPEVLAVLASPPYFSDLLNRSDLSGNYGESSTVYAKTDGGGSGYTASATISVGTYMSFEQDIQVFGVTVASVEAEASITAGFTYETEKTSTLEQTVTYTATSGEDKVAFYSIPMEIYEYTTYVPDGTGSYKAVESTVNIPHEAQVKLLGLSAYESIAKDYSVLTPIADNVLTHKIGDPTTYPSSSDNYNVIAEYDGTPASVGYTSSSGGSTISQEIAMSTEKNNSYSGSLAIEGKAGAGAGGLTVGVTAGAEGSAGYVQVSTSGSSFSGELQDMPSEAEAYGYRMDWRIFCYKYQNGDISFPVVNYLVSDVARPAALPDDFAQDVASTTDSSVALTWTYDKPVSGFQIYRYYEFPDGKGSKKIQYVPFSSSTRDSDGLYHFTYTDSGLSPYTEYSYQIQTESAYKPYESIYSEPLSCRTKTTAGYPDMKITGLDEDGNMPIYPDASSYVDISVANQNSYNSLSYSWQKYENGEWSEIPGNSSTRLTIANAGSADEGTYRCHVNAIYYDPTAAQEYYISAYSDQFDTAYSKRTPVMALTAQEALTTDKSGVDHDGVSASVELHSANSNHSTAPTGSVIFKITGTDYEKSLAVNLAVSGDTKTFDGTSKYYSTASCSIGDLPEGVYSVSAYYSGSYVFKDYQSTEDENVPVIIGNAEGYQLTLRADSGESAAPVTRFTYGESIYPVLTSISKNSVSKVISEEVTSGVTYEYSLQGSTDKPVELKSGDLTPDTGTYILKALVSDSDSVSVSVVSEKTFTVSQKPITVSVDDITNVSQSGVSTHPPVISCSDISASDLSALNLTYSTINSAGNTVTLAGNIVDPGNYTVTACKSAQTPDKLYNDYAITWKSGTYTVIGLTYRLTVTPLDYSDSSGTRAAGTAGISGTTSAYGDFTANSSVVLYANPYDGYEVDKWTVKYGDGAATVKADANNSSRLTLAMEPSVTAVTVSFRLKDITLEAAADTGGTISCTNNPYFTSGAFVSTGADYTFRATPDKGYHFSKWQITTQGTSTAEQEGTLAEDGTSTVDISVGTSSIMVKALFTRDSYTLSLSGDITAFYMRTNNADPTGPKIKTTLKDGASVAGDTGITVMPKTGYQADEGSYFVVNGETTDKNNAYTFNITQNTAVSLQTVRNKYNVTTTAENGSVNVTAGDTAISGDGLSGIEGGTKIVFTAAADRGYVFDHWTVNGTDNTTETTGVLTVAEIGSNLDVTAVFRQNTAHTASGSVSDADRGTLNYTLYDIYGNTVDENTPMPESGITVYDGESLLYSVSLESGSMVEQWNLDGSLTNSPAKTYPGGKLTVNGSDLNMQVTLKGAESYVVNYIAVDGNGSSLSATADGTSFDSGDKIYGGSSIAIRPSLASQYMVDYWTVTTGGIDKNETAALNGADGLKIVDPVLNIDGLNNHITARAHFTQLAVHSFSVASDGVASITYATPVNPEADGSLSGNTNIYVRDAGTVKVKFTPAAGLTLSEDLIRAAIAEDDSNAVTSIVQEAGSYIATVKNITADIDISGSILGQQLYSITLPPDVTASSQAAAEGTAVTLNVTPESGQNLSSLTVTTATGKEVNLNETVSASLLTYTFAMPAEAVTVAAAFQTAPAYAVTVPANVTASAAQATAGSTVTLTVSPASGYRLSALTVTGAAGNVPLNEAVSASRLIYTFTMPSNAVTAAADFTYSGNGSGGGGGGGGGSTTIVTNPVPTTGNATIIYTDSGSVTEKEITDALKAAGNNGNISIVSKTDTITIPEAALLKINDNGGSLTTETTLSGVTMTLDHASISGISSGSGDLVITMARITAAGTSEKELLNELNSGAYVYNITAKRGVTEIHKLNGSAKLDFGVQDSWNDTTAVIMHHENDGSVTYSPVTVSESAASATLTDLCAFVIQKADLMAAAAFSDVSMDDWFYGDVDYAKLNGLFSGISDTEFGPSVYMTRGMLVTVLYRLEGSPAVSAASDFKDMTADAYYADAVAWASSQSIVNGLGNNLFGPDNNVTREQMASILYRYVGYKNYDVSAAGDLSAFTDAASVHPYAADAVKWAVGAGLIQGSDGLLSPADGATRAQVAAILTRFDRSIAK